MIRQLSETVILPIAGLVLTFVATYELIQYIAKTLLEPGTALKQIDRIEQAIYSLDAMPNRS